jgi:hypothetical protein
VLTDGTTAAPVCLEFFDGRVGDDPVVQFTCGLPTLCGGFTEDCGTELMCPG